MASSESFAERLKTYRKVMGWTQEQLAKEWSYSPDAVSAWEREVRLPSGQQIPRLAKLLQIEPEELLGSINTSRSKTNAQKGAVSVIDATGLEWKSALETWGEIQNVYRDRSKLSREFSYPRAFEEANDILVVGVSLNAIALNYSREEIIRSIIEKSSTYTLCFLDPDGAKCAERGHEEHLPDGYLESLLRFNLKNVESIRDDISKRNPDGVERLRILTYDLLPRFSIYMFDNTVMTVQSYAYGRGEDTPCFLFERHSQSGLFEFYASAAHYILDHSKPFHSTSIK